MPSSTPRALSVTPEKKKINNYSKRREDDGAQP
jgi:hypothetical protein